MTLVIISALQILSVSGLPAGLCEELVGYVESQYEAVAYCTAEWEI